MPASAAPRAAIYARFSSDRQDERSIADQVALCRDYAARQGWHVVATYSDAAISGASIHGRTEYQQLLADAEARRFDVIIAEDVDRFARNSADAMRLKETADFIGVRIFTVADGEANELLFGFKGLMGALWLKTHALKVRRGQEGRVRAGLVSGGQAYGYAPVPGKPGERAIVPAEAEIVRRVFAEYLAGRSPREIAQGLNADHVPAPRGAQWNASTLNGSAARGSGLLFNALFAGVIRWNRVRMVKDPATGKRISRINAAEARRETSVPALAIVTPEIFAAVQERKAALARIHPSHQRRPARLLSGLLRCAACGGGLSTAGVDKSGRTRVRCSNHKESRSCPAPATFYLDTIERTVLETLRAELREPAVIAEYVRTYHAERQRLAATGTRRREAIERRLGSIERELKRLVDGIAQEIGDPQILGARTKELAAEQAGLEAERAALREAKKPIALHPAVLKRYEQQVAALQDSLARGIADGDRGAAHALRDLVESVTVARDDTRPAGIQVTISGRLEAMLGATTFLTRSIVGGISGSGGGT